MNEVLLNIHNEPIDIYEEQKQLKKKLALDREAAKVLEEQKKANMDLHSLRIEQDADRENHIQHYREVIKKIEKTIEEYNLRLSDYFQKKEQYETFLPTSQEVFDALNHAITLNQRGIEHSSECKVELEQLLEESEKHTFLLNPFPLNLPLNEIFPAARNEIAKLEQLKEKWSETATKQEQSNSELKERISTCLYIAKEIKNNPNSITHEDLVKSFELIVEEYAELAEEHLGIVGDVTNIMPYFFGEFLTFMQYQEKYASRAFYFTNNIRDLDSKNRDHRKVENIKNGSMGKYMEGDIPFINYLNSMKPFSNLDVKKVSKEVELGNAKDRGVTELMNILHEYDVQIPYEDAFLLRLLLVEHYKAVEKSTKNGKLDYNKNYFEQYQKLAAKADDMGATLSPPFRNPNELKIEMIKLIDPHTDYVKDILEELIDTVITRLPSIQ